MKHILAITGNWDVLIALLTMESSSLKPTKYSWLMHLNIVFTCCIIESIPSNTAVRLVFGSEPFAIDMLEILPCMSSNLLLIPGCRASITGWYFLACTNMLWRFCKDKNLITQKCNDLKICKRINPSLTAN